MTKKYLIIATFLILILGLSYGVSRRFKFTPTQPQPNPSTPPQQNQQSSPSKKTPEPTITIPEGWKTFTSEKIGYSISYPGDWYASDDSENLSLVTIPDIGPLNSKMTEKDVKVLINPYRYTPQQLKELGDPETHLRNSINPEYRAHAEYVKETSVAGQYAIESLRTPLGETELTYTLGIGFIKDGIGYSIRLISPFREAISYREPTFREMLETFTFF